MKATESKARHFTQTEMYLLSKHKVKLMPGMKTATMPGENNGEAIDSMSQMLNAKGIILTIL